MAYTLVGVCMLLVCAMYLCKVSSKYFDKMNTEYKEFISFLYTLKQKISTSSQKISVILSNMQGYDMLEATGFLPDAKKYGVECAFTQNYSKFLLKKEDKELLSEYFCEMGKGMLCSELENINRCINALEESYGEIKKQSPSKKKVNNTLIICTVLLCIILIV